MIFNFVIAALATYRLAHLLPYDDGPFFIFKRLRLWVDNKAVDEQLKRIETSGLIAEEDWIRLGFWSSMNELITCPYCQGLYAAILCGALVSFPTLYGNLFLIIMAIAGSQSLIQKWSEK